MATLNRTQASEIPYRYLQKYGRTSDTWTPRITPDTVRHARDGLNAIKHQRELSLLMLESIVSLTAYPESIRMLSDSTLLDACVQRLFQLQRQDPLYPFGYEHGYLLFRIGVLSTGILMLSREPDRLEWVITEMSAAARSENSSKLMMKYINDSVAVMVYGLNKDHHSISSFLGWTPEDGLKPLISPPKAMTLLDILWKDRKGFLRAWGETHAPELYGLLVLLWSCLETTGTPDQWAMFANIFHRYCLVAGDDSPALNPLKESLSARSLNPLDPSPVHRQVDLEDSRMALRIYTERIASRSLSYPALSFADACFVLMYLFWGPNAIMRGTEDLLVPLMRATFEYYWVTAAKAFQNTPDLEVEDSATPTIIAV
ncbi:hypothetical protein FRC07_001103 [Ceratobasidium sp. 392]|nr:hypothetical protein FRC07_001103 [Ceratobasidium sp. 392]